MPIARGGTGATDAEGALVALGAFPAAGGTIVGDVSVLGVLNAENVTTGDIYTKDGKYICVVSNSGTTYAALRFGALKPVYAYRGFSVSNGFGLATEAGVGFTFGSDYITANKPVTTHCITCRNATATSMTTNSQALDVKKILTSNTDLLQVSDDASGKAGILCAVDGTIAVSGCVFTSSNAGDTTAAHISIVMAAGGVKNTGTQYANANSNGAASVAIATRYFDVRAGDIVMLYCYNAIASRGTCPADTRTVLSVQYC